jgi:hypothetical protein
LYENQETEAMSEELNRELEKKYAEIAHLMGMERENLQFQYSREGDRTVLHLITVNPRHRQSFLFHTETGFGEMDTVAKLVEYIKTYRQAKDSYTIQWAMRDSDELHTSYFRGANIYAVLDKFYFGKDIHSTIIFSISLNPLS